MLRRSLSSLIACMTLVAMLCQGTWVLAGTTGTISGTIIDTATNKPLAGAKISATSPSQNASVTSDAQGHYTFLSLVPDTYVLSVEFSGYDSSVVSGVTVQADQTRVVPLNLTKSLTTIATVHTRSASALVKPGTTADVYSISATQQDKLAAVGGGGNLNSAWSAIATVPGVFVLPGQSGYIGASPTISIRGGDYTQIGYEIDGVPVNRAFDNYPSGPASSLGQGELQVYTGGSPANAEANGISGFINQVIRTGSYPGFSNADLGIGGPAYYHKASFEIGGASPDHNFSYYLGVGGYNQDFRTADQFNGAAVSPLYGTALAPCFNIPPGPANPATSTCFASNGQPYAAVPGSGGLGIMPTNANPFLGPGAYVLGPVNIAAQAEVVDRDNVLNLHYGIPHKDGTKDDIQFLGMINYLNNPFYGSTNDQGGAAYLNAIGLGQPFYLDGYSLNATPGTLTTGFSTSQASPYYYPGSSQNRVAFPAGTSPIPVDNRDGFVNNQSIYKLQYTKSLGSDALFKVYGYTYYSDWIQNGPQTTYADFQGCCNADYELSSHTRGLSGTFTDQLGSKNLLTLEGSATTATTTRDNNTQMLNAAYGENAVNARTVIGVLVNASNPYSGLCYTSTGSPTTCSFNGPAQFATISQVAQGGVAPITATTCGTGACEYLVTDNGEYATYNTVKPNFYAGALTDEFRPTSQLTVDAGVRFDDYQFVGSDTTGTAARTFFYNAFNMDNCLDSAKNLVDKVLPVGSGGLGLSSVTDPCPAGYTAANFTNPPGNVTQTYPEWEPRIGATYALNPNTVFRINYGRNTEAPVSAFEQYTALQQDTPALLYGTYGFQKFGFTTPNHAVVPPASNNYDFSWEQQFPNEISLKLSPFYRTTQNQIQQFYLNQQTSFISGLNVGKQTSRGVEFELDKGNFNQNGLSARLSFTYTNSYINYNTPDNGLSVITNLNNGIAGYNAYTSYCAAHPTNSKCGSTVSGVAAAPCYTTTGAPDPTCTSAGAIANPYWNAPVQNLLSQTANYATFDILPAGIGSAVTGYGAPYTASLVLNERVNRFAVAPIVQFFGGQRYGAPLTTYGVAPDECTAGLASSVAGDPRYKYGAPGGSPFDATNCAVGATIAIPDPYTNAFDGIGAFVAPSQLQLHLQLSYDVSKTFTLVANVTNIVNACFGGSSKGWISGSVNGDPVCGYGVVAGGSGGDIGNLYNPGTKIQPLVNTPYQPTFPLSPFGFFVNAKLKI
jgi:hypothetical protein